jgi:hypothetical protein
MIRFNYEAREVYDEFFVFLVWIFVKRSALWLRKTKLIPDHLQVIHQIIQVFFQRLISLQVNNKIQFA